MNKIGNRRAPFINYRKPGIFMITMNKLEGIPSFGSLVRNPYEPDKYKQIRVDYSKLGFEIFDVLKNFKNIVPGAKVDQYVIMPDHIHFLVNIYEELEMHLGQYLGILKREIFEKIHSKNLIPSDFNSIFEPGFNDQFLRYNRSLDGLYKYIRRNPYRLWIRFESPEFFRRIYQQEKFGIKYDLYGNPFLLNHPFKYPVVVHRSDMMNPEIIRKKREIWEYAVFNGGVLIGAFISEEEKKFRDLAFENGGKVILLKNSSYDKREKPSEAYSELCRSGNLLILSPDMTPVLGKRREFRQECLFMNAFAERIANE